MPDPVTCLYILYFVINIPSPLSPFPFSSSRRCRAVAKLSPLLLHTIVGCSIFSHLISPPHFRLSPFLHDPFHLSHSPPSQCFGAAWMPIVWAARSPPLHALPGFALALFFFPHPPPTPNRGGPHPARGDCAGCGNVCPPAQRPPSPRVVLTPSRPIAAAPKVAYSSA